MGLKVSLRQQEEEAKEHCPHDRSFLRTADNEVTNSTGCCCSRGGDVDDSLDGNRTGEYMRVQ